MSVQRYVFRYAPDKPADGYAARWRRLQPKSADEHITMLVERDTKLHAEIYADSPYEKEGGGLTTELTEAKIIGWKSAKKWTQEESFRGDLLPVSIALAPIEARSDIARDRAEWLLDAVATATQDRRYLRGDLECDHVVCEAILLNGEKAILAATAKASELIVELTECLEALLNTGGARGSYHALKYAEAVERAEALAAGSHRAKTAKRVECEASQSGPKGNAQILSPPVLRTQINEQAD